MVEAKFKSYGVFAIVLSIFLFAGICFFIYALISVVFLGGHIIKRGTLPPAGAAVFIVILTFFLVSIINSWMHCLYHIRIDKNEKAIFFKNFLTRKAILYSFTDFDGYLDTYAITGKRGSYKVLYLIKDKKAEKIITGFYYSNIDELQEELSSIQYLGFHKDFSSIARRALINKPII